MGRALPRFEFECSDSVVSRALQAEYHADIALRYSDWDPAKAASAEPPEVSPPDGAWLVAWIGSTPVGCGGIKRLDAETAEVKRLFLLPLNNGLREGGATRQGKKLFRLRLLLSADSRPRI